MADLINHPAHYTHGKIEVWDAIEDWRLDYFTGNVVKYIARAAHKGAELQDLRKARAYLDKRITQLEQVQQERLRPSAESERPSRHVQKPPLAAHVTSVPG